MSLTDEKNKYWKERLEAKVDATVEELKRTNSDKKTMTETDRLLSLTPLFEKLSELNERKNRLNEELEAVLTEVQQRLRPQ